MSEALAPVEERFAPGNLGEAMTLAGELAACGVLPKHLSNRAAAFIVLDTAMRLGMSVLMVAQNLYVVHGTPSWKGSFCRALVERSGKYSALRYEWQRDKAGRPLACRMVGHQVRALVEGAWITWDMVKGEGWSEKSGSKWKTMPEQMFMYRAAAFFHRAHCPEAGLGLPTVEEVEDIATIDAVAVEDEYTPAKGVKAVAERIRKRTAEEVELDLFAARDEDREGA